MKETSIPETVAFLFAISLIIAGMKYDEIIIAFGGQILMNLVLLREIRLINWEMNKNSKTKE